MTEPIRNPVPVEANDPAYERKEDLRLGELRRDYVEQLESMAAELEAAWAALDEIVKTFETTDYCEALDLANIARRARGVSA